ncbi:kinetochore component CENP-S-domain-containing protein [Scheffersomyces xylosifermentans]|uniref:kinetochore component CENP-S-domain-containing protein n=1 Tax=Scheffersomyces xylosifermentans TaxID=1304137 RepID=UPI00315D2144
MPIDLHKEETISQLKSAVYLIVAKMVEEQLAQQAKETPNESPVVATPTFIASLVELVYNQLINLGEDLELFAQHAGRSIIRPDDLYMVTRKNDVLTRCLKEIEVQIQEESSRASTDND